MKKFSFSLQTVLDYKNQYLDSAKNEYASALADVNKQKAVIADLESKYNNINDEYNEKKEIGIGISEVLRYDTYLKCLETEIEKENIYLEKLDEILQQKFAVMVGAKQEVTSLDKLKEKRVEAYNYALQKQEEIFIEEFVSNKSATS